jgi:hypothetical protein
MHYRTIAALLLCVCVCVCVCARARVAAYIVDRRIRQIQRNSITSITMVMGLTQLLTEMNAMNLPGG